MIWSEFAIYIHTGIFVLFFVLGVPVLLWLTLRAILRAWRRRGGRGGPDDDNDRYVQW